MQGCWLRCAWPPCPAEESDCSFCAAWHRAFLVGPSPCAGLSVRELTGDMQLSKKELAETQASPGWN